MSSSIGNDPANPTTRAPGSPQAGDRNDQEHYEGYELNTLSNNPTQRSPPLSSTAAAQNNASRNTGNQSPHWNKIPFLPKLSIFHYVPLSSARDHLANERVFLAYIRTSSTLASFAVVILQLYRLKHQDPPPGILSDYDLGVPLAVVILVMAIVVACVGAVRFLVCQRDMAVNRILTSGWMVVGFSVGLALVSLEALAKATKILIEVLVVAHADGANYYREPQCLIHNAEMEFLGSHKAELRVFGASRLWRCPALSL